MVHLAGIAQGRCTIGFRHRRRLTISFDRALFPTLGIWWNHLGYPDEAAGTNDQCLVMYCEGDDCGVTCVPHAEGTELRVEGTVRTELGQARLMVGKVSGG